MESVKQIQNNGYDIEVWRKGECFVVDVKYPCGELINGISNLASEEDGVFLGFFITNRMPKANHENCTSEYCNSVEEKYYMNPNTGSVDTLDGWYPATEKDGLIEVIKNENNEWVEKE